MSVHARARTKSLLAVVAAASLMLGACSNSDDDQPAAAEPTAPQSTVPEASDPTAPTAPATTKPDDATPDDTSTADTTADDTTPATTAPAAGPDLGEFQPVSGVPGVTDEEIQFAVVGTGPSNPAGYCLLECYLGGVKAYFDYRNSLGGVHGRQLTLTHEVDDELANTQVRMLELIGADDVFGIFVASLIPAGFAEAAAASVPLYSLVQSGPAAAGHENAFVPGLFCPDCLRQSVVHQAQLVGATKVATLGLGASQASVDCVSLTEQAVNTWGPELGIEHVYANATLPFGMPNGVAPEVTAMKDLGVDFISLCIDQNGALTIEQEMARQGLADVPVLLPQGYPDAQFVAANAELLEGDVLSLFVRPFEADQTDTDIPQMVQAITSGGYTFNDQTVQGWINADMAVTGLLAAGPQFDRAGVIAATNAIAGYDAGGVFTRVDFTKQHTAYTGETMISDGPDTFCAALVRVEGGAFTLIGDPDAPFFEYSWDRDWVEPVASNCRA